MYTPFFVIFSLLFCINKVNSADITSFAAGSGTLPTGWDYHRGFYSTADDKIYLVGYNRNGASNPWIFDPATQTVSEYTAPGVSGTSAIIFGEYGAVINNVYYYIDQYRLDYIHKFDPINAFHDDSFAGPSDGVDGNPGKCITSNNIDTLYILRDTQFQKLDVTQSSPHTLQSLASPTISYWKAACSYYNGYVYAFFGDNNNEVMSKYNVATNVWQEIGNVPAGNHGNVLPQAVLAGNDKIYIGGTGLGSYDQRIYEFDPTTDIMERAADTNDKRSYAALVYSNVDSKLYVFAGLQADIQTTYEVSNVIGTDI